MPSGPGPASSIALRTASAPSERVLRPEWREYAVSPTPTMQYLPLSPAIRAPPPCVSVVTAAPA